jgi:hypothetical protein
VKLIVRNDRDRDRFIEFIKQIKLEKPFTAIFEPLKKKRTLRQNRLAHMWFQILEDETGTSAEAWKEHYKRKFLTVYRDDCFGEEVETVMSTKDLTTVETNEFLKKINLDASENGYYLPWPDDMGYDDMILRYGG